jgi:hypothetical protein
MHIMLTKSHEIIRTMIILINQIEERKIYTQNHNMHVIRCIRLDFNNIMKNYSILDQNGDLTNPNNISETKLLVEQLHKVIVVLSILSARFILTANPIISEPLMKRTN